MIHNCTELIQFTASVDISTADMTVSVSVATLLPGFSPKVIWVNAHLNCPKIAQSIFQQQWRRLVFILGEFGSSQFRSMNPDKVSHLYISSHGDKSGNTLGIHELKQGFRSLHSWEAQTIWRRFLAHKDALDRLVYQPSYTVSEISITSWLVSTDDFSPWTSHEGSICFVKGVK